MKNRVTRVGFVALLAVVLVFFGRALVWQPDVYGAVAQLGPRGISTVGDYVWYDADLSGLPDAGEPGIDNVLIKLYRDDGDALFEP